MKNKVALITGASRGIGAACAVEFAKEGYDIAINFLNNSAQAQEIAQKCQSEGVRAIAIQADLAKESDIEKMFEKIDQEFGVIDVLINNGGVSGGKKPIAEIDFSYLQEVYQPNVFAVFACCREAFKRMKAGSSVINISSLAAKSAGFEMSVYASSKAAVENLTIGLSREMAAKQIRVNAISPGVIDTDIHKNITAERKKHLQDSIPLGRMGTTKEVAQAAVWLASDKASYCSGTILTISGGK